MKQNEKMVPPPLIAARVGRIQYINVDPVYYAFDPQTLPFVSELTSKPPADLNRLMADGWLDISSVSSSAYARHFDDWLILPDLSIACFGKVMSVLLVSRYPFEELHGRTVILTRHSAAAADLIQYLFARQKIAPRFVKGKVLHPNDIGANDDAGLVIGDAALRHPWRQRFPYTWDLCEEWNTITGLPFVFAVWVVRRSFAEKAPDTAAAVLQELLRSKAEGLNHMPAIVEAAARKLDISRELCREYYDCMYYDFREPERRGLTAFYAGLYDHGIITRKPELQFFDDSAPYHARLSELTDMWK
jgi:chorismate dehydratase